MGSWRRTKAKSPICKAATASWKSRFVSWRTPIDEKELADLWQLLVGSMTGGSDALTPDGNLTLIDDIGSNTKAGKQFITLEGKKVSLPPFRGGRRKPLPQDAPERRGAGTGGIPDR